MKYTFCFLCSPSVYCAMAIWWGAAESGEHLHGWTESVWGAVAVHTEPGQGAQELIDSCHVSFQKPLSEEKRIMIKMKTRAHQVMKINLCVFPGLCLLRPASPIQQSPEGKSWYLTPVVVMHSCTFRPSMYLPTDISSEWAHAAVLR